MLRVVISGTISSLVMGVAGASIGALIYDTATIPFVVSACGGFMLGAVGFYRDAVRKSLRSLDRYPRLLQLHLDANFPHRGFETWPGSQFRSGVFGGNWVLQSMLVASWLTATTSLDVSVQTRSSCPPMALTWLGMLMGGCRNSASWTPRRRQSSCHLPSQG